MIEDDVDKLYWVCLNPLKSSALPLVLEKRPSCLCYVILLFVFSNVLEVTSVPQRYASKHSHIVYRK